MEISIKLKDKLINLLITPEGDFIYREWEAVSGKELSFSSEEFGEFSIVIPENVEEVDFGFNKFIEIAKGLSLIDKGILFLAYKNLKKYGNLSLENLIKKIFGKSIYENYLIEGVMGDFGYIEDEETEEIAEKFFKENNIFYTRVVGFRYRIREFILNDELLVKEGDTVYAVWEKDNPHDENAVAVYHSTGKKLGYLRRTLSPYISKILKKKLILEGKVIKVMPNYFPPDERVFLEVFLS